MANKNEVVTIRGKLMYAKVLGAPVLNYSKDGLEWKFDVEITPATAKEMKNYGIADRVKRKDNYLEGRPHLSFKQKEFKTNGDANEPIEVVDILGRPWDQKKLLGNGTVADVRFAVVDYGAGKKKGVYPRKIRVLEHIPYEGNDFEAISEDDEFFQKALEAQGLTPDFQKDFGLQEEGNDLDDDIDL